ncbi:MAG: rod shape-determining protein MreD [Pseudomonadota bacterium]
MGPSAWHIWTYRLTFVVLGLAIIAFSLLPLGQNTGVLVGPDLLLAFTLAWILRQPSVVPIGVIVALFLTADFLLQRPPGLWTALVLLVTESLRTRRAQTTEYNFIVEWAWVTVAIFTIIVGERFVLWVLLAPQSSLGLALVYGLTTAAVYPAIVLISHYVIGLRRLGPTDAESV